MKKILKIAGITLGVIILVGVIIGVVERTVEKPRHSILFLNTSNSVKSVTFELIEENGELSDGYYVNEKLQPSGSHVDRVPAGKYRIRVWDENDSLYNQTDFTFQAQEKQSNDLYRFDLAMDKRFAVISLNALYSGNDLAAHMSKAVGTQSNQLKTAKVYKGDAPFLISKEYTDRTFVDMEDKIPASVKYGQMVFGLFYAPGSLEDTRFYEIIYEKVMEKGNKM